MKQKIGFDTRKAQNSETLIDLLFTNSDSISCGRVEEHRITDHETISFTVKLEKKFQMRVRKNITSWENYASENLVSLLRQFSYQGFDNLNITNKVTILNNNISNAMSWLTYSKEVSVKLMNKWYDTELAALNTLKLNLYKVAIETGEWEDYNATRREYKHLIKIKKSKYMEQKITNNLGDSKAMWKYLKSCISMSKETNTISKILINDCLFTHESGIAQALNNYFIDSIIEISHSITGNRNYSEVVENSTLTFKFRKVTTTDILDIVGKFKNKIGGKKILSEGVIKDSITYTGFFYSQIVNESLETGIVPALWKTSVVVPIEKVKNTIRADDIRPINTLPCDEKILETVVKNQLLQFLEDNKIIIPQQSGFRRKHSCESALNLVIANWKEDLSRKKHIIAVFLDLKRAFETIDQNLLLEKLKKIGISGIELKWFENFIMNRYQRTAIGSSISEERRVHVGLPQGSVLAPILFNIYINDIVKSIQYCDIKHFADDTLLMISGDHVNDIQVRLQDGLNRVNAWLCSNKLKLNVNKTKFMVISRRNFRSSELQPLLINNEPIEIVNTFKYLGLKIDNKLSFNEHVDYTVGKIAKKLYFTQRTCKYLKKSYKTMVYRSIIEPHFIYCPTIFFIMRDSQIYKLQKQQNRAMRFILRKRYDTPIRDMLSTLNWLSVKQQLFYLTMKFIKNIMEGNLPDYLKNNVKYVRNVHSVNTRNRNDFTLPAYRTEADKCNLYYKGLKCYNELPTDVKSCNKNEFKRKLFNYCKSLPI